MIKIKAEPATPKTFANFGDLLDAKGSADMIINKGLCKRHHDRAQIDVKDGGRMGVSIFEAMPQKLPYELTMMERHPLGSQCFIPMSEHPFLVTVAEDDNNAPAMPLAFIIPAHTGVNVHRNIWHGVLTPLHHPGLFAVIDRVEGKGDNLQEHELNPPYLIVD